MPTQLPPEDKVEILRRNARIFYGAVKIQFERESIKQHADILNGAADEIERLRVMLDALLNHCDKESGECSVCSVIVCPLKDPMHFHHDGCPSCSSLEDSNCSTCGGKGVVKICCQNPINDHGLVCCEEYDTDGCPSCSFEQPVKKGGPDISKRFRK